MRFLNLGMEAIAFQDKSVAETVTKYISDIMAHRSGEAAEKSEENKKLHKYLKEVTGLNLNIVFNTDRAPCTIPFHFNPDTILGHKMLKEFYAEDSKETIKRLKKEGSDSFIDLKNGKVGGIFSQPEVPIWISHDFIRYNNFTDKEVTAILAHEIGHCFVAYEMAFRTVRTNQVLSAIAKASAGGDKDVYKYVLKESESVLNLKSGVLDQAIEIKDTKTVVTVVIGVTNEDTYNKSLAGNATYDITTFEAMADNFAARWGLSRDLVTGLEKIFKAYGSPEYSQLARVFITIGDIMKIQNLIIAPLAIVSGAPIAGIFLFAFTILSIYISLDGRDHNNVYDKLSIRFKRIKEQTIAYIKDFKLDPKEAKQAIETIEIIEKKISEISEYKGFLPIIFNMIDPASRKTISARDIQSKLETLAANDLYVKAVKMQLL